MIRDSRFADWRRRRRWARQIAADAMDQGYPLSRDFADRVLRAGQAEGRRMQRTRRPPDFTCPDCGVESWNADDGRNGYCGRCRTFPEDRAR